MQSENTTTSPKMAHKYKLRVQWSQRPQWDINILALNAKDISMWLQEEKDADHIISIDIQLVERNAQAVKDNFLAQGLD